MTALNPTFSPRQGALQFPCDTLNQVVPNEYIDALDWFQTAFGVYGWMQLTQNYKFKINQITGAPFLWQAANSCGSNPTKTLSIGQETLEPKENELFEKLCVRDGTYASLFEHLLQYRGETLELTPEMRAILDQFTKTLLENAAQGLRVNLTIGSFTDFSLLSKPAGTDQDVWDAIMATYNTSIGWLSVAYNAALSGYSHMDLSGVINSGDFNASGEYTQNPLDLYDTIKSNAPQMLKNVVASGGIGRFMPIFIVDPTLYAAIAKKADELAASPLANTPRISIREVNVAGTMIPRRYYVIDGTVVVVPVTEIQAWDNYAGFNTYAAYLTTAGNINLGAAFNELPMTDGSNIGITAALNNDPASQDFGYIFWRGFTLTASAFAYRDLVAGTSEQF